MGCRAALKPAKMARFMSSLAAPAVPESPVREGDVLASKYRVEKVLGAGGMGVVVAATHIELDERVALKFLLPQAASSEDLVERFLREARASVRLKGKHVAKTLDVGRLADNCPYIVMEFLDGHDLHAEIRAAAASGPIPVENAISYVLQAAEGLAEAHSRGIIHRDLKPGNLFLTRGVDGHPLVKVLDFGISKTLDTGAGAEGLSLTRTEMLLGSPLYMAPEQMRSSKHVDERSDLWALGAIAYELLTGRVPFEADTILELCFKVAQEAPPHPQALRPELPADLCAAILRCLEKLPEDRFGNVAELAAALEPFGLARDRGTAERARDVLGTGKRTPRTSLPSAPDLERYALPKTPPPTVAPLSAARLAAEEPASAATVAEPTPTRDPAPQAWGTTQSQPGPRSRKGLVAAAVGGLVLAGVVALAVTRHSAGPQPAAAGSGLVVAAAVEPSVPSAVVNVASPSATAPVTTSVPVASVAPVTSVAPVMSVAPANGQARPAAATRAGAPPAAASAPSARTVKPAPSAAPPADPGGFIKVRE
ncbi:MAG: hypothetical protein JWP97_6418 [Labilithrix sp.]|nr:hypothetical protein [Labilithrix sp.]